MTSGGHNRKRSDMRGGHRTKSEAAGISKGQAGPEPDWAPVDEGWPPSIQRIYHSLQTGGQANYFEQSDADYAYLICEYAAAMHPSQSNRLNSNLVGLVLRGFEQLLATESARRAVKIELQREFAVDAKAGEAAATVTDLRSRLGG